MRDQLLGSFALSRALVWSGTVVVVLVTGVLVYGEGWQYYTTSLPDRGFLPAHRTLRPAAPFGHLLGVVGTLMVLVPLVYTLRKRVRWLKRAGTLPGWLEFHIFCGIVGPVLVTFHTSFKFNGLVSVSFWSMVAVVASGFVGRYLYVRIPKTIRGHELTQNELAERVREVTAALDETPIGPQARADVAAFERELIERHAGYRPIARLVDGMWVPWRIRHLRRALRHHLTAASIGDEAAHLIAERALLSRRIATLHRTRRLFEMWHAFHQPLVYLMFGIAALHVGLVLYLGYTPW